MEGVRWAFSCGSWQPSRAEWLLAVRSIQPEEKTRIGKFVFARDAKAALVLEAFGEGGWAAGSHERSWRARWGAAERQGLRHARDLRSSSLCTLGGLPLPRGVASGDLTVEACLHC